MTEHEFTDLLGGIDPALVARAEARVPVRKKQSFRRTVIVLAAALLVLISLLSVAVIAYFPKTYDLDYEIPKHENASKVAQIYYTEDGKIKRQSVLLPPTAENIFMTWQHLNGLEDQATLIEIASTEGAYPDRQVVMTLSTELRDHPESETLLDSLQKTFAQYFVMRAENISFEFADQTIEDVGLHFYYLPSVASSPAVPGGRIVVTVGMTNVSDQDIAFEGAWSDFVPRAKLLAKSIIYVAHEIHPEPNDSTTEIAEYRLAPGQSREVTYVFHIPEQAPVGVYDLTVSFGEQSHTFERFVSITELSTPVITPDSHSYVYSNFLKEYGLNTSDPVAFKAALQALTHGGVGLFEIMNEADVDWLPGYSGEIYDSEQFTYVYSAPSQDGANTSHVNTFTATVLPDGMILPYGISPEEGLIAALCKLGMTEQDARNALEKKITHFFTDSMHSSITVITVSYNTTYIEIAYAYGRTCVDIRFDENGEHFQMLRIQTEASPAPQDVQVVFTGFMYDEFVYTLSAQQYEQFVFMLERAEKIADTAELECDSFGTVGNSSFKYDSKTGVLLLDGCTYTLTEQDRLKLNVMVSGTVHLNFDPSATIEVDSPYDDITHYATLSEAHRDRIIAILNDGNWEWLPGGPNVQAGDHTLTFWDADTPLDKRDRIEYHSETGLFVYNEYYLNISNADRLAVNDIFSGYAVQRPDT